MLCRPHGARAAGPGQRRDGVAWATDLYDNHGWWFRLGGLAVLAGLVWLSLRRRDQCSVAGVVVDRHLATTADGVYAAGDVTGLFPHTHAAYAMGRVAAGNAVSTTPRRGRRPSFDAGAIPRVVFTAPEIATVGAAEHEVTDRRARVAYLPLSEVDRAITADHTTGFVKLLAGPRPLLGRFLRIYPPRTQNRFAFSLLSGCSGATERTSTTEVGNLWVMSQSLCAGPPSTGGTAPWPPER